MSDSVQGVVKEVKGDYPDDVPSQQGEDVMKEEGSITEMAPEENGQEQGSSPELCTSPKTGIDENPIPSDPVVIETSVGENATDVISSSVTVPEQEEDEKAEKADLSELLVADQPSSPHAEQSEVVASTVVESSEVVEPGEFHKKYVYQPEEMRGFLELMKKISFTPFLDLIPIHHFRYHTQYQAKKDKEEVIEEWDMPDTRVDSVMDLSEAHTISDDQRRIHEVVKKMEEGEEIYIPEDIKLVVMNILYNSIQSNHRFQSTHLMPITEKDDLFDSSMSLTKDFGKKPKSSHPQRMSSIEELIRQDDSVIIPQLPQPDSSVTNAADIESMLRDQALHRKQKGRYYPQPEMMRDRTDYGPLMNMDQLGMPPPYLPSKVYIPSSVDDPNPFQDRRSGSIPPGGMMTMSRTGRPFMSVPTEGPMPHRRAEYERLMMNEHRLMMNDRREYPGMMQRGDSLSMDERMMMARAREQGGPLSMEERMMMARAREHQGSVPLGHPLDRVMMDPVSMERSPMDRMTMDRMQIDRMPIDRMGMSRSLERGPSDRMPPSRSMDRMPPDHPMNRVQSNRSMDRMPPDRSMDRMVQSHPMDRMPPDRLPQDRSGRDMTRGLDPSIGPQMTRMHHSNDRKQRQPSRRNQNSRARQGQDRQDMMAQHPHPMGMMQIPMNLQQGVQMTMPMQMSVPMQQGVQVPMSMQMSVSMQQGVQVPMSMQMSVPMQQGSKMDMPVPMQQGVKMDMQVPMQQGAKMDMSVPVQMPVPMQMSVPMQVQMPVPGRNPMSMTAQKPAPGRIPASMTAQKPSMATSKARVNPNAKPFIPSFARKNSIPDEVAVGSGTKVGSTVENPS